MKTVTIKLDLTIKVTSVKGIEVYKVMVGRTVVGEFLSERSARTYMAKVVNTLKGMK